MRALCFFLTLVFAQTAYALDLEPWQEEAANKALEYERIQRAEWTTTENLVLWSPHANVSWDVVADQHICLNILGRQNLTRPANSQFVVSVWHAETNKTLGIARCR